jgi:hypothetical protein
LLALSVVPPLAVIVIAYPFGSAGSDKVRHPCIGESAINDSKRAGVVISPFPREASIRNGGFEGSSHCGVVLTVCLAVRVNRVRAIKKVLVAWNGRREAARAVFDALPILQLANEVRVVWVNPQSEHELPGDIPVADICTALARHAVKCEAIDQLRPNVNAGETLLACAEECRADLLVMGCYGHARHVCANLFSEAPADMFSTR